MKRLITILSAMLLSLVALAQSGGIKGTVISRNGKAPVDGAKVMLFSGETMLGTAFTKADGTFDFAQLQDGSYTLGITKDGFIPSSLNVTVEKGFVRDLMFTSLSPVVPRKDVDDDQFTEQDLMDTGYSDSPTILFGSNDPYNNAAGYGFSAIRFKNRGYNSETQDVYLAGVPMNDAITGYSPYSLWSGLNEATRAKDNTNGMEASDYGAGRFNGVTNIDGMPSAVRPGWRFSVLTNSALYRLRLMATYASGQLDNGWSYAFNASVRAGGNDWVQGVYYRSFAFYGGVEKKFNPEHRLGLFVMATPGERGAQNASTQEVYDLMGDNMYNSNWGYQDGKVRNSRVRRTFEPIITLKYDFTPSDDLKVGAALLYRTGFNGYSALDWYDAQDPRPDYYRNLPSYYYMEESDYNRSNQDKYDWAYTSWTERGQLGDINFNNYQHLNWDRLYQVNRNNPSGRSKYALEERHVDQNDVNLAGNVKWNIIPDVTLTGGLNFKINRTENYKKMKDLLGGQYYLNVDQFAERDFAANEALIQNDLDYYLSHNRTAEQVTTGGKYGYDYYAQVRKAKAWANATYRLNNWTFNLAATAGYEGFWREGLVRKGLFAGSNDDGSDIIVDGVNLTQLSNGQTSKGKSAVSNFFTYSGKLGISYVFKGGHRVSGNVGYFQDAPTFNQAFVSARTRNTLVSDLRPIKTFSADLNYQLVCNGWMARLTGYYTKIMDQTDVMSFYDDSQQSFTNFAMTGIDQRHLGLELGLKVPLPVENLSITGVLALGEHVYTSTPHMVQTMDNSAEVVREAEVTFWQSTPTFNKVQDPATGQWTYETDMDGNYVVTGSTKHYVPSTPQLAAQLGVNYSINYWFFEINGQYFANSYLDMNPLYRTTFACKGGVDESGKITNPEIVEYMTAQEKFSPAFVLNASVGKSWYIQRKYQIGFSLEAKNLLNNKGIKTGGYEQTRLINSYGKDRYYRFDPKYFYMQGANYMLNIYFRF